MAEISNLVLGAGLKSVFRLAAVFTVLSASLMFTATPAQAAIPSGNSALDQYVEHLPSAGNNEGPSQTKQTPLPINPNKIKRSLGKETYRMFRQYGEEGIAAAQMAVETSISSSASEVSEPVPTQKTDQDSADVIGGNADESGLIGVAEVAGIATGVSGPRSSLVLFLVVVGVVLAMAGVAISRRSRVG